MRLHTITNQDTDKVDQEATSRATDVLEGRADEHDMRWWAYREIVVNLNFVAEVVRKHYGGVIDGASLDRIEGIISGRLLDKIVGDDGNPDLDINQVAAGSSLCGWARSYLRTMARYVVSDMARDNSLDLGFSDSAEEIARMGHGRPVGMSQRPTDPQDVVGSVSDHDLELLLGAMDTVKIRLAASTHRRPTVAALHEEAQALCRTLEVPMPRRVGPDAKPVMRALLAAPDAAVRQVMAKLVARLDPLPTSRESVPVHDSVDDAVNVLAAASCGITFDQAQRIHSRPTGLVRLWVGSVVHDRMSPPRTHIDEAVRQVSAVLGERPGVSRLGFRLVHAAVRSNCEMVPGPNGGGSVRRLTDDERTEALDTLNEVGGKVAATAPDLFGDTVEDVANGVLEVLGRVADEVFVEGELVG